MVTKDEALAAEVRLVVQATERSVKRAGQEITRGAAAKGSLLSGGTVKALVRALLAQLENAANSLIAAHVKRGGFDARDVATRVTNILRPISESFIASHAKPGLGPVLGLGSVFRALQPDINQFFDSLTDRATVALGNQGDSDRYFAEMAIEEARKSVPEDETPRPKVGAVVVKDGNVVSKAHRGEKPKPQSHAEYIALEEKLPDDLVAGATVYTTLEPCTTRKHPKIPCAQRLVDRKVSCVVIGMLDPNPDIRGRGFQFLRKAGVKTRMFDDDLMSQCEEMNREFIKAQEQRDAGKSTGTVVQDATKTAARSLTNATQKLEKAVWSFYALHTQPSPPGLIRDVAHEEKPILEKIDDALDVFAQDYDLPSELAAAVKLEVGNINIALVRLKSRRAQEDTMKTAATHIREACERIRSAAKPYAYGSSTDESSSKA